MADIDLKTLTPDTSLPTTGFLFGADSQATANPSVYSTQTVATTLLGSTSLTGDTLTASAPVLNLTQTWNNVAVTFTGMKFNVASDTSAAASLLMDLQVGGTSQMSLRKDGRLTLNGPSSDAAYIMSTAPARSGSLLIGFNNGAGGSGCAFGDGAGTVIYGACGSNGFMTDSSRYYGFGSSTIATAPDTILTRRGAANLRLGAADAAAPVAQTLSVQSVVAGTSNTAGAAFTVNGSIGTGTGAGGSIIFQVAPAGSSGSAQNALVAALTINSARQIVSSINGTSTVPAFCFSGDPATGLYRENNLFGVTIANNTTIFTAEYNGAAAILRDMYFGIRDAQFTGGTIDTRLYRDAAGVFGVRGTSTSVGAALSFIEQTAPASPAANIVRIYAEDNGSGKTRLMALFATGVAQQIAIEP